MSKEQMVWKKAPEADDYSGTMNFLSLIFSAATCKKLLRALRAETNIDRAAKDLLPAKSVGHHQQDVFFDGIACCSDLGGLC